MTNDEVILRVDKLAKTERQVEQRLRSAVRHARRRGITWQTIADALGTTRQSAWKRFSENEEGAA